MTAPLSTDEATALLTSILMDPQWSVDSIADLPKDDPFGKLCYDLAEIRAHVQALSKGDLSRGSKARGFVAGESISIFTIFTRSPNCFFRPSNTGCIILQGPHQVAKKSTNTRVFP